MEKTKVLCSLIVFGLFFWILSSTGAAAKTVDCDCGAPFNQTIQSIIDDPGVVSGDTISVYGTCNENVIIRKSLTVDGNTTAEIHGPDSNLPTVQITTSSITVRNFKSIQGGSFGIYVSTVFGATIFNNTIESTGSTGILFNGNLRSTIDSNTIQNTGGDGIDVLTGSYAIIINNVITNNPGNGILISENSSARIGFSSGNVTSASPNTIEENDGQGILVTYSSSARIVGNTISTNGSNGIRLDRASYASISNNTIDNNTYSGIDVAENSEVKLGNATGATIFDLPNATTVNNGNLGLRCSMGSYVTGQLGTLNGVYGNIDNAAIGIKTSDLAGDYGVDIMAASNGLIRLGNGTRSNNTTKAARMVVRHYNNAEEPVYLFGAASTPTNNFVAFGGGSTLGNAATQLDLYTAPNQTTLNGFPRLTIIGNGNVGIGTQTPSYPLQMSGGAYSNGGSWIDGSSREYKEEIEALSTKEAMEAIKELNPVKYAYKTNRTEKRVGFIAEDVPDLIATKDRKGLSPMDIVAVLTKVVQDQQKVTQEQEKIVREQQKTIAMLSEKVTELERVLQLKGTLSPVIDFPNDSSR